MASLFKRQQSTVWWTQYYVKNITDGRLKKIRRSTGHRNKKAALASAIEMERMAQGVMAADSDKARRAKAILAEAVAKIESETFNITTARKVIAEFLSVATGDELPMFSIEGWCKEWERRKARESTPSTMARYSKSINAFVGWLAPQRATKPLESVTVGDIRKWREQLKDEGRTGNTVNKYVKDIGAVYRAAIREGLLTFNPCSALEPLSTDDSIDRKPFALAEVAKLLNAAPTEEWRGLIFVATFTGLRLADAAKLRWESIDLEAARISLMPAKTRRKKRTVQIPIQTDLLSWLSSAAADKKDREFVLPKLARTKITGREGLSNTFTRFMEQAGISRGKSSRSAKDEKGKGRLTYEKSFHSFRHTFTTWLRGAGVSEEDRMALTGHSTRDSHAIYSHVDETALKIAISKLPMISA